MLAITLLTGRRPALLRRTVASLARHCEALLASSHVTVLVNGADSGTLGIVKGLTWADHVHILPGPEVVPIGAAVSDLMDRVPREARYVLHMEDDWECTGGGWASKARWILDRNSGVGQVRLRWRAPPSVVAHRVSPYHMVTRKRICWREKRGAGFKYEVGDAHFTFNPSLVRRDLLDVLYPCAGELTAARAFGGSRQSAQLLPGSFRHLGGDESLRERLGRSTT